MDVKDKDEHGPAQAAAVEREISTHVGFLLARAHLRFRIAMQAALAGSGLHLGQVSVLGALSAAPVLSQRELTDLTGIEKSSMVLVIDALETMKYVRRRPLPGDRRVHAVALTSHGARELRRLGPLLQAAEESLLGRYTGRERRTLAALLRRLTID